MPLDWDEVKTWFKDTTKIALKEAEELTTKGKIKMEIFSLSHKKDRLIYSIGDHIYAEYKKNMTITVSQDLLEIIDELRRVEERLRKKKDEAKNP